MSDGDKASAPIRIGVSSCLLGEEVRFDGGHKRDNFITRELAEFVELVPVCPEVEVGMPTPRPAIRLSEKDGALRLIESPKKKGEPTGADHTAAMARYASRRANALAKEDLCGYIFKSKSPSCGLYRVPIYREGKPPLRSGRGAFAAVLTERLPHLPVEEEGRLCDPALRENFVERVFAYARLRAAFKPRWRLGDLVAFHSREKLLLLAHRPASYKSLGQLVARGKKLERAELAETYQREFLEALAVPAKPGRHVNVMQHMLGYFKDHLESGDKKELAGMLDDYRAGLVPLVVPITLFRFFVRRHEVDYLAMQSYLNPHPKELMLRNRR